jgi:predicted nuclease with TOPRIM domain
MTEVLKDSFETRMKIREFDAKIKNLAKRVNDIEKKQAERFPHLIERLDRIEGSFPAIVDRLKVLERENSSGMDYSGAFETDIDYG